MSTPSPGPCRVTSIRAVTVVLALAALAGVGWLGVSLFDAPNGARSSPTAEGPTPGEWTPGSLRGRAPAESPRGDRTDVSESASAVAAPHAPLVTPGESRRATPEPRDPQSRREETPASPAEAPGETEAAPSPLSALPGALLDDINPSRRHGCMGQWNGPPPFRPHIRWHVLRKFLSPAVAPDIREQGHGGPPFERLMKPCIVLLVERAPLSEGYERIRDLVLANEKITLGMRAFHAVVMSPRHAAEDPVTRGHGTTVPRFLIVDPAAREIRVIEHKKIKVSLLYKAMQQAAHAFYEEDLNKTVKQNFKFLIEKRSLWRARCDLEARLDRATLQQAERRALEAEVTAIRARVFDVERREVNLWKLTPRMGPGRCRDR